VARVYADRKGEYKTPPLAPGTYELQAWKQGFYPDRKKIKISNVSIKVDFELIPKKIKEE